MTEHQAPQHTPGSTEATPAARIQEVSSYLNLNYNNQWSWKIDQLVNDDKFIACVGHILIPGGREMSGIGEVAKANTEYSYKEAEALAMEEAAKRIGWTSALHSVSQEVPESGPKVETKTEIRIPQSTGEKAVELKEAYRMTTRNQFLTFVQICRPEIQTFEEITPDVIEYIHKVAVEQPEHFRGFKADAIA